MELADLVYLHTDDATDASHDRVSCDFVLDKGGAEAGRDGGRGTKEEEETSPRRLLQRHISSALALPETVMRSGPHLHPLHCVCYLVCAHTPRLAPRPWISRSCTFWQRVKRTNTAA